MADRQMDIRTRRHRDNRTAGVTQSDKQQTTEHENEWGNLQDLVPWYETSSMSAKKKKKKNFPIKPIIWYGKLLKLVMKRLISHVSEVQT